MAFDATFWATAALVIFIGLMIYLKVPGMITKALDRRISKIETELAEAERLRAEAKALLEDYQRRREDAEKEAEGIVAAAREEAFRLTAEAGVALRSEEHTSELQSQSNLVCRLLLEKKKKN